MWKGQDSGIASSLQSELTAESQKLSLPFSRGLGAMQQIHIPNERLRRHAFDADFTLPSCALFADPHYPKLGLILIVLEVEEFTGLDRANHSLQHRSTITDVSDLGILCEGQGFGIDTPDAHRQECGHASIATTIHRTPFWNGLMGC